MKYLKPTNIVPAALAALFTLLAFLGDSFNLPEAVVLLWIGIAMFLSGVSIANYLEEINKEEDKEENRYAWAVTYGDECKTSLFNSLDDARLHKLLLEQHFGITTAYIYSVEVEDDSTILAYEANEDNTLITVEIA